MPRYEFVGGTSSKFWEVQVAGTTLTTTYGRIGAAGSSTSKGFPNAVAAQAAADKLVAEKLKKGYQLVGGKGAKPAKGGAKKATAAKAPASRKAAGKKQVGANQAGSATGTPPRWRSLAAGEVTLAELQKLLRGVDDAGFLDDCQRLGRFDVNVVDGDLSCGSLSLPEGDVLGLVVTGNLTLGGDFTDSDYPATSLFVLGDMRCKCVVTAGRLSVQGSLYAEHGVMGDYNDYSADIGGDVVTPVFWSADHGISVGGKLKAKLDLDDLKPEDYPKRLVAGTWEGSDEDDYELNRDEIKDRLLEGRPVAKPGR